MKQAAKAITKVWSSRLCKFDDDKREIFGIVYEPDVVDLQGDFATEQEIRAACHRYLVKSRIVKEMHEGGARDVDVVQCYTAPVDFEYDGLEIKKGTWCVLLKVNSDEVWSKVKDGTYQGLSMGGSGDRIPA